MNTEKPPRGKTLALTGALFQLGPLLGAAATALGMMHAFNTLGSLSVTADPQQLSANIGNVLIPTAIGLGISLVGLILICIALSVSGYRAPWFFWFLRIYGYVLLCVFPVGTIFGIALLAFCLTRRREFLTPAAPNAPERSA